MFDIYKILKNTKKIQGLEIEMLDGNNCICKLAILNYSGKTLTWSTLKTSKNCIDELVDEIDNKIPISLVITGKGVLIKTLEANIDEENDLLLKHILPNVDPNDFYMQLTQGGRGKRFVAIIRKKLLDTILVKIYNQGFSLMNVCLGPFSIISLLPLLESPSNNKIVEIEINEMKLSFENGWMMDCKTGTFRQNRQTDKQPVVMIANQSFPHKYILALASSFQMLKKIVNRISLQTTSTNYYKDEWKSKFIFSRGIWASSISFIFILLINFLLLQKYTNKNELLNDHLLRNKAELDRLDNLKNQVITKTAFLKENKWLGISKTSYYSDQVGKTIPKEITLTSLKVFPFAESKNINERSMDFISNMISIEGNIKEKYNLYDWIEILKTLKWIDQVSIKEYSEEKGVSSGHFTMEIRLNT